MVLVEDKERRRRGGQGTGTCQCSPGDDDVNAVVRMIFIPMFS